MSTDDRLNELLANYFNAVFIIESAMVFDRNGLLITKKTKKKLGNLFGEKEGSTDESDVYGAITGIVEKTLNRITTEYEIGSFGTGTFETEDHRLVFTEAGPQAILLSIFNYEAELNSVMPYCFLVAEKISLVIEGRYHEHHSLSVPNLELGYELGIDPSSIMKSPIQYNDDKSPKKIEMRFKLVVLGDQAAGKTSLINQFVTKKFYTDYRPTLGISITSQLYALQGFEESGTKINLMIWDLAGQKFFRRVRKYYLQNANAAFIVYDSTSKESFDHVRSWHRDVKDVILNIPIVILGNKIDLESERKVSYEQGATLAKELRCSFMETSAKTGQNVRDTFSIIGIGLFFKAVRK
jgi:Ras-related protein Rab-6A